MSRHYHVHAPSLSQEQFIKLMEDLKGFTFIANIIPNASQALSVTLNPGQTLDSVIAAFPNLENCEITQCHDHT